MAKVKRVMMAITSMRGGGAQRVVSILCNQWVQQGIEVAICCTGTNRAPSAYTLDERVKLYYAESPVMRHTCLEWDCRIRRIRMKARRFKPDVIVAFMDYPAKITQIACKGLDIPMVFAARTNIQQRLLERPDIAESYAEIYPQLAGAVFQTESQQKQYHSHFAFSPQVAETVITNPVAPSPFWAVPRPENQKTIVAVGREHPVKNYALLLRAFARISNIYPDWSLFIYGKLLAPSPAAQLVAELGLQGRVRLPGFSACVDEQIHRASIYVLSSLYEGLPNALIEAMCLGVPCISTDFEGGGARLLIENKRNGLVVPNNDEAALAAALKELIENPDYARRLGKEAANLKAKLQPNDIAARWVAFLEHAVARYTAPTRGE